MRQTLSVELHRGQLVLRLRPDDVVAETVLRVGQTAVRISDSCLAEEAAPYRLMPYCGDAIGTSSVVRQEKQR